MEKPSASPEAKGPAASGKVVDLVALPVPVGDLVKISGLNAKPELNGQLAQVLRLSESKDRVVVKTGGKEIALKPANLQGGFTAVVPGLASTVGVVLFWVMLAAAADVFRSKGRSAFGAAATPAIAFLWVAWTLGVCGWLYRPCRPADQWLPSMGALGSARPARGLYRLGFCSMALMFALTSYLYGELMLPRMLDVPLPILNKTAAASRPADVGTEEGGHQRASEDDDEDEKEEAEAEAASATAEEVEDDAEAAATARQLGNSSDNATNAPSVKFLSERSVLYGYGVAAACVAQGLFPFDGGLSLGSIIHVSGGLGFAAAATQHAQLSSLLMTGPRGQPLADAAVKASMPDLRWLRTQLVQAGPLVLLGIPLMTQIFNKMPGQKRDRPTFKGALHQSGLLTSARSVQWGTLLLYSVFVGTYAVDFFSANI